MTSSLGGIEPFSADNVEVEVDLLWRAVRPLWLDVVWNQLDAELPLAIDPDVAPACAVFNHRSAKQPGPEGALGVNVRGVEHDHPVFHVHLELHGVDADPGWSALLRVTLLVESRPELNLRLSTKPAKRRADWTIPSAWALPRC